tara:strand:- start:763 stop:966 length:204 start_codon:yes stop_codon:yes gene_type:complete
MIIGHIILNNFDNTNLLLAKIKVKEDKLSEYLELADKIDKAVEANKAGILHNNFDQEPENPLRFVWS